MSISMGLRSAIVAISLIATSTAQSLTDFPICAQSCQYQLQIALTNASDLVQLCSSSFRASTAACQAVLCNTEDRQKTNALSQEACGPLYRSNATLSSAVSAAIASATPLAIDATAGRDPTDVSNYPQCAQKCQQQYGLGGCGTLSNRACICLGNPAVTAIDTCEHANCSPDDLIRESALAQKLCQPVGGIFENHTNPLNASANTTAPSTPSPSPFTGGAPSGVATVSALSLAMLISTVLLL